ncbi:MAG TPA: ABC transporter substrate-binding protein [Ideonella sp.]|nr:ABC transporter substrate-binding protein [Ideonella sp.]
MRRRDWRWILGAIALAAGLGLAPALQAKTLRWAARGDAQSMDPHAVNEGVTNNIALLMHDLLEHVNTIFIMSKAWCIAHHVERPPDYNAREEAYSSQHAMGSGPFTLKAREPGGRTTRTRNPHWWGSFEGNVDEVIFTPIASDATRLAAVMSGAIWHAIDVAALKKSIMRDQSQPAGCMTTSMRGCAAAPELEAHPPPDLGLARKLMAEAGHADGFDLTLDCPNDREMNTDKRRQMIGNALRRVREQAYYLPLHRQMLTWLSRANVKPVLMPNNRCS